MYLENTGCKPHPSRFAGDPLSQGARVVIQLSSYFGVDAVRSESAVECHIRPNASCPSHETNAYGYSQRCVFEAAQRHNLIRTLGKDML